MDKNISILIYEKENHLNSILYQQLSDNDNHETYTANNQINLLKLVNKKTFDIFKITVLTISGIFSMFSN